MEGEVHDIDSLTLEETFLSFWEQSKLAFQAITLERTADLNVALGARDSLLRRFTDLLVDVKPQQLSAVGEYIGRIQQIEIEMESGLRAQRTRIQKELQSVRKGKRLAKSYARPKIRIGGAIFGREA